ncbi:hypothetical protein [Anaerobacillus alkalilacustris]|nr:hypothetical protein [Anaerobacillus alkalilacustris]
MFNNEYKGFELIEESNNMPIISLQNDEEIWDIVTYKNLMIF